MKNELKSCSTVFLINVSFSYLSLIVCFSIYIPVPELRSMSLTKQCVGSDKAGKKVSACFLLLLIPQ